MKGTIDRLCMAVVIMTMLGVAAPTSAQDTVDARSISPQIFGEARLRFQLVDVDESSSLPSQARDGEALTARLSLGAEVDLLPKLSLLAEAEGVLRLGGSFNDGRNPADGRPFIPDVEGLELNRAQLTYEPADGTRLTLGRQRIALDDWRFIGAFPFRQNRQSFDAIRFETGAFGPGQLDVGYFGRVLRPLGEDNTAGRFKGDSSFANYAVPTKFGLLNGFHYRFDLETGGRLARESNASHTVTGIRIFGRRFWDSGWGVGWEGSFARQTDFADNPLDYRADYGLAALTVERGNSGLVARFETLGSDNGVGFQTPLASLHRFQGFADVFFQTPDDGVRDLSVTLRHDLSALGPLKNIRLLGRHHRFSASVDDRHYGSEWDASITARWGRTRLKLEAADYAAKEFSTDRRTIYVSTSWDF